MTTRIAMPRPLFLTLVVAGALLGVTAPSARPDEHAALATALLDELNRLRADPPRYAAELAKVRKSFSGEVYVSAAGRRIQSFEGPSAFDEAIAALRSTRKLPKLRTLPIATAAARAHARELGARGARGHVGKDGSRPLDRVLRHADFAKEEDRMRSVAEVISYGAVSPAEIVQSFLVDDGVPDRGHRAALLDPTLTQAGAGCAAHEIDPVCVVDLVEPQRAARR